MLISTLELVLFLIFDEISLLWYNFMKTIAHLNKWFYINDVHQEFIVHTLPEQGILWAILEAHLIGPSTNKKTLLQTSYFG